MRAPRITSIGLCAFTPILLWEMATAMINVRSEATKFSVM